MWTVEGDALNWLNGGLSHDEAQRLRGLVESVARPGMLGFEVGGFTGWTASQVLPVFKANGGHFYFLDWFRGSVNTQVAGYEWPNFDARKVLIQSLVNFEVQEFADITTVLIGTSLDMPQVLADRSLDYVYIGADHRYTPFKADLRAWMPKVRVGGVLCGHAFTGSCAKGSDAWNALCALPEYDMYPQNFHFGVVRAVTELLPGYEEGATIWSWRKPTPEKRRP